MRRKTPTSKPFEICQSSLISHRHNAAAVYCLAPDIEGRFCLEVSRNGSFVTFPLQRNASSRCHPKVNFQVTALRLRSLRELRSETGWQDHFKLSTNELSSSPAAAVAFSVPFL